MLQLTRENFVVANNKLHVIVMSAVGSEFVLVYVKQNSCPACVRFDRIYWDLEIENSLTDIALGTCTVDAIQTQATEVNAPITQTPFLLLFYRGVLCATYTKDLSAAGVIGFVEGAKTHAKRTGISSNNNDIPPHGTHPPQFQQPQQQQQQQSFYNPASMQNPNILQQQREAFSNSMRQQYSPMTHSAVSPVNSNPINLFPASGERRISDSIYVDDRSLIENKQITVPKGNPWKKDTINLL